MNNKILYIVLLCLNFVSFAQVIHINNNDDIIKVTKNTTATIDVDYAFIVPPNKASLINTQLAQLVEVKNYYADLKNNKRSVLVQLNKVDKQLRKLLSKLKKEDADIDENLEHILSKIDHSITNLNTNNTQLKATNITLNTEVKNLKKINTHLKKISRGIWWNGFIDKTIMLVAGTALGILITSI